MMDKVDSHVFKVLKMEESTIEDFLHPSVGQEG